MNCRPTGSPKTCILERGRAEDSALSSSLLRALAAALLEPFKGRLGARTILLVQLFEFVFPHILDRRHTVLGAPNGDDELRELELNRERVSVLRVLDQKRAEECYDGCRRFDHKLPSIA